MVFVSYDLAFPIAERGVPLQTARINTVNTLLQNDSFLDGILNVRQPLFSFLLDLTFRVATFGGWDYSIVRGAPRKSCDHQPFRNRAVGAAI